MCAPLASEERYVQVPSGETPESSAEVTRSGSVVGLGADECRW
ncbi:hypothetical protein [Halococcoides cellulosivorans]|nr:hypothetical protein [Halococcoides cellulosivorans]